MKKTTLFLIIGVILGGLIMLAILKWVLPVFNQSAIKNSFAEVTAKLDSGGEVYAYFHTERLIRGVEKFADKMKRIAAAGGTADSREAQKAFDILTRLFADSGLNEISGIGFSSKAIKEDLFHSTFVVHHYPDKGKGLIWNLGETAPHSLDELQLLPADAALVSFSDFNLQKLWDWLLRESDVLNLPELKQGMLNMGPSLKQQGIDGDKLFACFGGRFGYLITLDKEKKFKVPIANAPFDMPEPGLAIFMTVKDTYIFDLLQGKLNLPPAQKPEEKGVKILRFPKQELPFPVAPVILQKGNWLIFSSNPSLADAMINADNKVQRLTATDEYKKLSSQLPSRGNGFQYFSPRILQLINQIIKKASEYEASGGKVNPVLKEVLDLIPTELAFCGVRQNNSDGTVFTFNHNVDPVFAMLIPAAASAGIITAIAMPSIMTSVQKGKQKSTMGDMRNIGLALEAYITDNGKIPDGATLAEMSTQLVPFYIKTLPLKDAWGNDFLLLRGPAPDQYKIASPGRDGVFQDWEQSGSYAADDTTLDNDIIFGGGMFVYAPGIKD